MFRKKLTPETTVEPDLLRLLPEILNQKSIEGLLTSALSHALQLAPAATKAYAVVRRGQDIVTAVKGYSPDLLDVPLTGPWASGLAKVSTNLSADLFMPNAPDIRSKLEAQGMRNITQSMVIPIRDRSQLYGAMILDAYGAARFDSHHMEHVMRWATALGPQVTLVSSFNAYQQLAWGLTRSFVEAVEARDYNTLGHAQRVTSYAVAIGRELQLSITELQDVWFGAMLHDIGKLLQDHPDSQRLEHTHLGYHLLSDMPALEAARSVVLYHHEYWNGTGGPKGLSGEHIPLFARIVAVCNAYDHLTSERGQGLDTHVGLRALKEKSDVLYDAHVVRAMEQVVAAGQATADLKPETVFPN